MRNVLAGMLIFAYLFALVMSTGHLAEWYRLTLGSLPGWFAVGLAAALEASAFLLSLLSNSLLRDSRWAGWGSLVALGLVWVGNFFSMNRAGQTTGIPAYEVFLASLFVPVSTYVVAKVLGELLSQPRANPVAPQRVRETVEVAPALRKVEVELPGKPVETARIDKETLKETAKETLEETHNETLREETPPVQVRELRRSPLVEAPGLREQERAAWVEATLPPKEEAPRENGVHTVNPKEQILEVLFEGRTMREIVEVTGFSRSWVYKTLKKLEEENLARKEGERWVRVQGG